MIIENPYTGRKVDVKTWLGLWMEMMNLKPKKLAQRMVCCEVAITKWRRGGSIGKHLACYLRALYPDAPVSLRGGPVPMLHEKLPVNARTFELYRFLLKVAGMAQTVIAPGDIYPLNLEYARFRMHLKPGESPIPGCQPDPDGIADMLPPADGGELDQDLGV